MDDDEFIDVVVSSMLLTQKAAILTRRFAGITMARENNLTANRSFELYFGSAIRDREGVIKLHFLRQQEGLRKFWSVHCFIT